MSDPTVAPQTTSEWYERHGCSHAHCPNECEHPQPFMLDDGRVVCGRCAILDQELVDMLPCTPETCS
jgi:hypothetical protein